ncbi:DUF1622 domain-containing protein [Clostridium sp.]|uniref:DUF1622 domain-containing protein n=1 Tax=Clostridium sp. TaxID=1506 RepID=UPI003F41276D
MIEELINKTLPFLISILEVMGIIVITVGSIKAFYHYVMGLIKKDSYPLKWEYANSMATALEFKLAAEILKTVIVRNLNELIILGSITLLRGFLTFIIHWEMTSEPKPPSKKEGNNNTEKKRKLEF